VTQEELGNNFSISEENSQDNAGHSPDTVRKRQ